MANNTNFSGLNIAKKKGGWKVTNVEPLLNNDQSNNTWN
jgi:hypothetical protein